MRLRFWLSVVLLGFGSPGCLVLSVHPLYGSSPQQIDHRLIGRWQDADTGSTATIDAGEWTSYRVTFTDRAGSSVLTAHETAVGAARFLDLTLEGGLEKSLLLLPLHAICRMVLDGNTLTITPIDYDSLARSAEGKALGKVQYTIDERKNVILSADTATLQAWLRQHLTTPGFFGPAVVLTRMPD